MPTLLAPIAAVLLTLGGGGGGGDATVVAEGAVLLRAEPLKVA